MVIKNPAIVGLLLASALVLLPTPSARAIATAFAPGDVIVSLERGEVQWRRADGALVQRLVSTNPGTTGEGMAFDAAGNLYVGRWCTSPTCLDTVEKFNIYGISAGPAGSGYNCLPHAVVFDGADNMYVGQAGCTGAILKFAPGGLTPVTYSVAPENRGAFWIDLAADGCTMFYTSWGSFVKRFDVCGNRQLPDFNVAPLVETQDLRVLPDGGVLVSSGPVIARLDRSGMLVQTYTVVGEPSPWAGLDLVGDGTFWAGNYYSGNVYRFHLDTGAVHSGFSAGLPFVVGIRAKK